ncbi:MAG: efflux RND transporter permease subunit, partial [Deltaproteobacteria bacterium]|nr:efflux RND transporter permease subunit [Deltaproteobacteria bacterium]
MSDAAKPRGAAAWVDKLVVVSGRNPKVTLAVGLALALWGAYCLKNINVDAIPDLSETQVIIFTEWMGQSPELVEKQVTYPLSVAMLSAPKVNVVRGLSMFGMSFVYVIFKDGTDIYWARSRTLEYLSKLSDALPPGVTPTLGPDATGVGWVFQYALVDRSGKHDLAQIKTFQDWYLRYWLASVPGVAEVASVGGYEKQYQIDIDPNKLAAYKLPLERVISAVQMANGDVGGRTLEMSEHEYYVRARGYITDPKQLENASVGVGPEGTPIRVRDVAEVTLGPSQRRGIGSFDGLGDTVGGVVVMRQGEDVTQVIADIKKKLEEVKSAFPPGVEVVTAYDRSGLIHQAVWTLTENLLEELVIVCLIIMLFL